MRTLVFVHRDVVLQDLTPTFRLLSLLDGQEENLTGWSCASVTRVPRILNVA
jgi:hypothetical protein